jgi:hypothetical protein
MQIQTDSSGLANLGNLSRQWVNWLTPIVDAINAILTAVAGSFTYYDAIPDSSGSVEIDFTNGFIFSVTLGPTALTILAPVFTGGVVIAGMRFSLYIDQDATGGRINPIFTGGAGAFASDVGVISIDPTPSTETACQFTFDGNIWKLDYTPRTGGATS